MSDEEIKDELQRNAKTMNLGSFNVDLNSGEEMNFLYKELGIEKDMRKRFLCREIVQEKAEQRMAKLYEIGPSSNKKQRTFELVPLPTDTVKPTLGIGNLAKLFGGLLDRKLSILECQDALVKLARGVGNSDLDKNEAHLIGLSAPTKAGKTEFLRWVFNNWCTWTATYSDPSNLPEISPAGVPTARDLITKINAAIPDEQNHLSELLVLFASFNQSSIFIPGEGPIVDTTVERLFRSYVGNAQMNGNDAWQYKRYDVDGKGTFDTIVSHFSSIKEGTGFIFCIDEMSNVREGDHPQYQILMDTLMSSVQRWLQNGVFCAVLASSLSIYHLGDQILKMSGHAMEVVNFPRRNLEMGQKASEYVQNETNVFQCSDSDREREEFHLAVATSILETRRELLSWNGIMHLERTSTRVAVPPQSPIEQEAFTNEELFLMIAQGIVQVEYWQPLQKEKVEVLVRKLGGTVELQSKPGSDRVLRLFEELEIGRMILPAWRLFGFRLCDGEQVFQNVENWVISTIQKLFYTYNPDEVVKAWELGTMAVLELRRAVLLAHSQASEGYDNALIPTLREIIEGLNVKHNLDNETLDCLSTGNPAGHTLSENFMADMSKEFKQPCHVYSSNQNEEGIEGVLRAGFVTEDFDEVQIFYQMKLKKISQPGQILDWLQAVDARAKNIGLQRGRYVNLLFVTGSVENNIAAHQDRWPANSIVFGTQGLKDLFDPFGKGIIETIIQQKSRGPE